MNEIKSFLYSVLLAVATIALLVVLGNWLGLLGIVLAFMLPMLAEVVRLMIKASRKKRALPGVEK